MFHWGEAETDQNKNTLVLLVWRTKHRVWCNCKPWKVCVCTWRRRGEHKPRDRAGVEELHALCTNSAQSWTSCGAHSKQLSEGWKIWTKIQTLLTVHCWGDRLLQFEFCEENWLFKGKRKKESWDRQNRIQTFYMISFTVFMINVKLFSVHRDRKICS